MKPIAQTQMRWISFSWIEKSRYVWHKGLHIRS